MVVAVLMAVMLPIDSVKGFPVALVLTEMTVASAAKSRAYLPSLAGCCGHRAAAPPRNDRASFCFAAISSTSSRADGAAFINSLTVIRYHGAITFRIFAPRIAGRRGRAWPVLPDTVPAADRFTEPRVCDDGCGRRLLRAGLHDTDDGSRDFAFRDPEGNRWSFGTYRGSPGRSRPGARRPEPARGPARNPAGLNVTQRAPGAAITDKGSHLSLRDRI